jgi:hypothetical protein
MDEAGDGQSPIALFDEVAPTCFNVWTTRPGKGSPCYPSIEQRNCCNKTLWGRGQAVLGTRYEPKLWMRDLVMDAAYPPVER